MNLYAIYEGAMQVVPLLLIALFLDRRSTADQTGTGRLAKMWFRFQNRIISVLGIVAFFVSMFVVAGVLPHTSIAVSVVISALSGSIGLLFALIWRRIDADPSSDRSSSSSWASERNESTPKR
ncbi:hypothetical protein EYE40_15110 [Glaciihabitans arcticus]|uniref:Uncharacterized protein n=1 Tax=Glaciihabitans arcticus TaxID=2668039 RepID=A0A4Q9GQJ4_9MICO|nr:hypothetical protein [Glaciihabitans arcticus]TBN55525.1 hypothetical protein EYE40_15110 [Glaciihabitans arcticus]